MKDNIINTVTVVGANGTMGRNVSAIFASFGNAKVYMISRELNKSLKSKNIAYKSVKAESINDNLIASDYSQLEQCILESDLIFESTSENWNVKADIISKIALIAKQNNDFCKNKIFASGTSGLSITKLAELFDDELRQNFMGIHMFNPPYTMSLCEITPTVYTDQNKLNFAELYCQTVLHRTTVKVKDSPAFLGNRIGFQFINEALQKAEEYKYNGGIDYIDAILGPFTGRAMAPIVTANFVGLDVHCAIVDNLYDNTNDFAHDNFIKPQFVKLLVDRGCLGKKTNGGLYKTILHDSGLKIHQVYDIETDKYRNEIKYTFPFVEKIIGFLQEGDYEDAFSVLKNNHSFEAELCCSLLLKYVIYSLNAAMLVGYDIHSADDVMATGFNWCPPLAMIEAFGGKDEFFNLCKERLDSDIFSQLDLTALYDAVDSSKYDYRKFIKAKR